MPEDMLPPRDGARDPFGVSKSLHLFGDTAKRERTNEDHLTLENSESFQSTEAQFNNPDAYLEARRDSYKKNPAPDPNTAVVKPNLDGQALRDWKKHPPMEGTRRAAEHTHANFHVVNNSVIPYGTNHMYRAAQDLDEVDLIEAEARRKLARTQKKLWINDTENTEPWNLVSRLELAGLIVFLIGVHIANTVVNYLKILEVTPALEDSPVIAVTTVVIIFLLQLLIPVTLFYFYKNFGSETFQRKSVRWAIPVSLLGIVGIVPFVVDFTPTNFDLSAGFSELSYVTEQWWGPYIELGALGQRFIAEIALAFVVMVTCLHIWRAHKRCIDNPEYVAAKATISLCQELRDVITENADRMMAINIALRHTYAEVLNETYRIVGAPTQDLIEAFCQLLEEAYDVLHRKISRT